MLVITSQLCINNKQGKLNLKGRNSGRKKEISVISDNLVDVWLLNDNKIKTMFDFSGLYN